MRRAPLSHRVRSALRFGAAMTAVALVTLLKAADAQTLPQIPPPSLISPLLGVGVPILFQWTPVNPGNIYNFALQSHTRAPLAAAPFVVYYELQISDAPDITSHVLVDVTDDADDLKAYNQPERPLDAALIDTVAALILANDTR